MRVMRASASLPLAVALLVAVPASALALGNDTLGQSREFEGYRLPPPQTYPVPGGKLDVSPVEILAGQGPQTLRFRLRLNRAVGHAIVRLELPEAWIERPKGGVETTTRAREASHAGED